MRRGLGSSAILLAALCGLAPPAIAAEPGRAERAAEKPPSAAELASARKLFAQAIAAEDQEKWAEALEIYERVSRIAISPSLRYHMGVCHEELGDLVEAVNAYELAASSAAERREAALAKESRARLEKARARIAQVTIEVPPDAEGLRIEIDGQAINPALAGTAIPINPGARRVVVRADNYPRAFVALVQAAPGQGASVRADLGARRPRGAALAPVRPRPSPAPPAPEEPSLAPAFITGGVAVALAAGAVATGVAAYSVREDYLAKNANPAPGSLAERQSLREQGQALAITSTALTGGAVVAGAIATYLFWPSSSPRSKPSARVTPWVGPDGAGLGIGGAL
ncbi:MAG: hypothetical protein IT372_01065 [Polyangiaceae bacterium]|nr:hypothetical protein [Polyangiaceae bacterium]